MKYCAVVAASIRGTAKTSRSFTSVTYFAPCARTRSMASPTTELVVSIPEVQLHKVPTDCAVVSTWQHQSSLSASMFVQVEGGQESLLEWASFSIELFDTGNDSQLVACVRASYLAAFLLASDSTALKSFCRLAKSDGSCKLQCQHCEQTHTPSCLLFLAARHFTLFSSLQVSHHCLH